MTANFVGKYIDEMRDCTIAAAASRLHVLFIGAPGYGKTSVANDVGRRLVGDERFSMVRFDPTTGTEAVYGPVDFPALMGQKPVEVMIDGFPRLVKGTPSDPECRICVADEFPRGNMAAIDSFVKSLDMWENRRGTMTTGPTFILTANFLPKDERSAAVLDRIGLTLWVKPDAEITTRDIVEAQAKAMSNTMSVAGDVPTLEELEEVWSWSPSDRAVEACVTAIELLCDACNEGLAGDDGKIKRFFTPINPRRKTFWTHLLIRVSMLYHKTPDFDAVHPKAMQALRYAWTCKSEEEFNDWTELVDTIADPITALIESTLRNAYETFNAILASKGKDPNLLTKMGVALATAMSNVEKYVDSTSDPRYTTAADLLNKEFSKAVAEASKSA